MAYRLLDTPSADGEPKVNADAVLDNMLGVYRMDALMTGDSAERSRVYGAMAGRAGDGGAIVLGEPGRLLSAGELDSLSRMMGEERTDVYRSPNAVHLLGNYPTALNRAGYEYYRQMEAAADSDTVSFGEILGKALVAFGTSLQVEPWNPPALELYPLMLVQAYRDEEAKAVLSSMAGNVPEEVEERIVYSVMRGLYRGGLGSLVRDWLVDRVAVVPDRLFYRRALFGYYVVAGQRAEAEAVAEAWATYSGQPDPEMGQVMEDMRARAQADEQQRIRDALEGTDGQ
jgi:hypothetical protein